jgi:hypothetical protein
MRARSLVVVVALVVLAGCGGGAKPAAVRSAATPTPAAKLGPCSPPPVHRTSYPGHGKGLDRIPWIAGRPRDAGLVGLAWYWPKNWPHVREARIFTGGMAPAGYSTKMLWVFLAPSAKRLADTELRVQGRRMDGPGSFSDTFAGIGYEGSGGAPSYASIIDVPKPGCWRLTLTTGKVKATVDLRAVRG